MLLLLTLVVACKDNQVQPTEKSLISVSKETASRLAKEIAVDRNALLRAVSTARPKHGSTASALSQGVSLGQPFSFDGLEYEYRLFARNPEETSSRIIEHPSSSAGTMSTAEYGVMIDPDVFYPNETPDGQHIHGTVELDIYKNDGTNDPIRLSFDEMDKADSLFDEKGYPIFFIEPVLTDAQESILRSQSEQAYSELFTNVLVEKDSTVQRGTIVGNWFSNPPQLPQFRMLRLRWLFIHEDRDFGPDEYEMYAAYDRFPFPKEALYRRTGVGIGSFQENRILFPVFADRQARILSFEDDSRPWRTVFWILSPRQFLQWALNYITGKPPEVPDAPNFIPLFNLNQALAQSRFKDVEFVHHWSFNAQNRRVEIVRDIFKVDKVVAPGFFGGDDLYVSSGVRELTLANAQNIQSEFGVIDTRNTTTPRKLTSANYVFTLD
ncbi:MAG: hypothetical protein SNJ55_06425 [Chloroherpetonaceae bacterium]